MEAKMTNYFSKIIILAMLFSFGCKKTTPPAEAPKEDVVKAPEAKEKVKFEMFVMSQCPFGVMVENAIAPALEKLGDYVDFQLNFIGEEPSPGQLSSMHGENEVKGDIVQLCAKKYAPEKYMKFILCMNKDSRSIPNNWEGCANENQLDVAKLKACYEGEEGKQLLSESFKKANEKSAGGSPTMFVNDKPYQGGRETLDFLRGICAEFKAKPEPCKDVPEPKEVHLTVLSDKRCKECNTVRITSQLRNMFPKLVIKEIDYGDEEGKKLYGDLGLKYLPAYLFGKDVMEESAYQRLQRFMEDVGEYKNLKIGARFDPTAEICDNKIDDTNDGKVDCDDDTCKNTIICRAELPNKLDVFVMSECPFGIKALNSMKEVLEAFEKKIDFDIHFIADESGGSLTSMHGQSEVDENIRELCVIKHYGRNYKYMDYILCRNENIKGNWEDCTGEKTGVSKDVIKKCFEGDEGKNLLREDLKIAKSLDISGSPTWLANNKYKFSAVSAEQIRHNLCLYNKNLKGCEKTLSGDTGPTRGSCGGN